MTKPYRDLHPFWWLVLPLLPVSVLLVLGLTKLEWYNNLTYKEGPVEWLGIVVCVTGAVVSCVVSWRRRALPTVWLRWLPVVFFVGFVFMAGEESSWGQHILNPRMPGDTEEVKNDGLANVDPRDPKAIADEEERQRIRQEMSWLKRINDQGETNLHNLPGVFGDIFGKLPKQLIEFGSVFACIIVPLFLVKRWRLDDPTTTGYWLWPTKVCMLAALIAFLLPMPKRIYELFKDDAPTPLRLSETQELYLAILLLIYIASMAVRLKQHQRALAQGLIADQQPTAKA